MLHTNTTTHPVGSVVALVGAPRHLPTPDEVARVREQSERRIDEALAESFPASDPPAWNLAMARLTPRVASPDRASAIRPAVRGDTTSGMPGIVDLTERGRPTRTLRQALASSVGAAGLALLAPFAILAVGLPVALAGRAVLEVLAWIFGR